jgi:ArsR family transcriptional regulator, arsenate/arsenite/antimonite-responsive transcriptional repressor
MDVNMSSRMEVGAMAIRKAPPIAQPQAGTCCPPIGAPRLSAQGAGLLSRRFAALADPVRLRMLSVLATVPDGAVCACDLAEPIGRSQPTVSHHLQVLKRAGLVTAQRDGKNIWYVVVPALDALREVLSVPSRESRAAAADGRA